MLSKVPGAAAPIVSRNRPRRWERLLALLVSGFLVGCVTDSREPRRYNILLVSIDTLRADHLPMYGYPRDTAPFLRELASEAALFQRAYAHSSFTLTSHMSLFTSLFPAAHAVETSQRLSGRIPTLPELLRSAGYETVGFYAQDWLSPRFGFGRGFSVYERREDGAGIEAAARRFLRRRTERSPFFLFLHFRDVHSAHGMDQPGKPVYDAPLPFRDRFLPHPKLPVRYTGRQVFFEEVRLEPRELANLVARYDGGILYVDAILRRLVDGLRRKGQLHETVVLMTSDHGEALGDRGKIEGHGGFWEEGLRVPLLLRFPDAHPEADRWRGRRLDHPVQTVDILPTLLEFAGIEPPASIQGRSLRSGAGRDVIAHREPTAVLIRGRHKLVLARQPGAFVRLYDLADDPGETRPLEARQPALAARLRRDLEAAVAEHRALGARLGDGDDTALELDTGERERLRALGYLD